MNGLNVFIFLKYYHIFRVRLISYFSGELMSMDSLKIRTETVVEQFTYLKLFSGRFSLGVQDWTLLCLI